MISVVNRKLRHMSKPRQSQHTQNFSIGLDGLISVCLFVVALYAYTYTLAPNVLEGDGALFQYTPYVLGVTYPTGFPLYILIGKVWTTLIPFGTIAWRMNFLSAFCAALALPFIYNATRRLFGHHLNPKYLTAGRWAGLATTLIFATLPTFWLWSTGTKTYALNILLFSLILFLLAKALDQQSNENTSKRWPLLIPAFILGLQISVHNTAVLLGPGLLLFVILFFHKHLRILKAWLIHGAILAIPGLFYLYIPIRAQWLIAQYGQDEAIARGLLADFYKPGWDGLLRYYTAADFTGGVATNWGQVPGQFFSHYIPILTDNFTAIAAILGLVGAISLLIFRPRLFFPLFLIYAIPIPFVLAYGQGEQSAFLLPSFLMFSLFIGHLFVLPAIIATSLPSSLPRPTSYILRIAPLLLFLLLGSTLLLSQTRYNFEWLDAKWARPTYEEWTTNLNHPMEENATMVARWGDLTSFWYLQYAEEQRPDLRGLYPPQVENVRNWFEAGGENLYIAGPMEDWSADFETEYQLLPWGRLVRIAPHDIAPETLLPDLPYSFDQTFDQRLHLVKADFGDQIAHGKNFPIALSWQTLAELPPETTISLRLTQGDQIVAQVDDTLKSGWFPHSTLPVGQNLLTYTLLPVPLGTLPGQYSLQLVTYASYKEPWTLANGNTLLDLGTVDIRLPNAEEAPSTDDFETIAGHDFNAELRLADYDYSVRRVGQGKGFAVKVLWETVAQPVDNYKVRVDVVDREGNVLRSVEKYPLIGQAPTSTWQKGQFVRDQIDIVLPASTPVGDNAIQVQLSWVRPDGSRLSMRRWSVPFGETLGLDQLEVTEKEDRIFTPPPIDYQAEANFENKAQLLGFALTEESAPLTLSSTACESDPTACTLSINFVWRGLAEMDQLYFVFLHIVDSEGNIHLQHDRSPGKRGKQPTTSWLPNEIILDPVDLQIPANLPPGDYTIRLGLYLPPTGPRLLVLDKADQPTADFVDVGKIEITK